jgi:hypothetical protein
MTTHELAGLLEHLRDGLGPAMKDGAGREFADVAGTFREMLDKPLREFVKDLQKLSASVGGSVGLDRLVERIRASRTGSGESADHVMKEVNRLKQAELQALIRALGNNPGKNRVAENRAVVRKLLEANMGTPEESAGTNVAGSVDGQVAYGLRVFRELRDAPSLSIEDLRARFAPLRQSPRAVLHGIAHELGYDFPGGKDDIAEHLLQMLERMRISQLRGDVIKGQI